MSIVTVPKVGKVKADLLQKLNIQKGRWGEFLPVTNDAFKSVENYRPYNFSQGNQFTAIASDPRLTGDILTLPYNPYQAFDPINNPYPTYYSNKKNWAYIKISKWTTDQVTGLYKPIKGEDINFGILNGIFNKGTPNIEHIDGSFNYNINKQYPIDVKISTDGVLRPTYKTAKYYDKDSGQYIGSRQFTTKINHVRAQGKFQQSEFIDIDYQVRFSDPAIAWWQLNKAIDDPNDSNALLIPIELKPHPERAKEGYVLGVLEGRAPAFWNRSSVPDRYNIDYVGEGGDVYIELELQLEYSVAQSFLELTELKEGGLNTTVYNDLNNKYGQQESTYKNFTAIRNDEGMTLFNFISSTGLIAWGSSDVQNIKYQPSIISSLTYNKEGNLIDMRHYWLQDELPDVASVINIQDGLWDNKENLNLYLSRLNISNFPHCYGAKQLDGIQIPTLNIPQILDREFTYKIETNLMPLGTEVFTLFSDLYVAAIDAKNKLIYFTLVSGIGYFLLDLSEIITHEIDFCGFDKKTNILWVGKYNLYTETFNEYSQFKLTFFIEGERPSINYEFKKMQFSFIPCQTPCLAKGGIISKV